MTSKDDIVLTQSLIKKELALESGLTQRATSLEDLKQQLIPLINHLLDNDLNRLLTALYRMDVNEQKVKEILATGTAGSVADRMAELIIDREMLKVATRRKYNPGKK